MDYYCGSRYKDSRLRRSPESKDLDWLTIRGYVPMEFESFRFLFISKGQKLIDKEMEGDGG